MKIHKDFVRFAGFIVVMVLIALFAEARALELPESSYNQAWCDGRGTTEYHLYDNDGHAYARVDCMTETHAVETEWAIHAHKEGIGQALWYANETGYAPGLLIIVKDKSDCRYAKYAKEVARRNVPRIDVWQTGLICVESQ